MLKFGKTPPRALDSFGVAGVLGENCHIFYDSLYSTRHIGRVSDLLSARLKKVGPDELRLRAILLFTAFEAYRGQLGAKSSEKPLAEPMVVECGLDGEKIAIGVSFTMPEGKLQSHEGLADRVAKRQPATELEALLVALQDQAHRTIFKVQPSIRRVEIVSLLGIQGKMDDASLKERQPLITLLFDEKNTVKDAPKAAAYVELGDLDYPQLLREDGPGENLAGPATGEILIKSSNELEEALRSRGKERSSLKDKNVISGVTEVRKDEVIRVKASEKKDEPETVIRISGTTSQAQDQTVIRVPAGGVSQQQVKEFQDKIEELQRKVTALEAEKASLQSEDAESGGDESEEEEESTSKFGKLKLKGLFGKVKGALFKDEEEDEDDEDEEGEAPKPVAATPAAAEEKMEAAAPAAEEKSPNPKDAPKAEAPKQEEKAGKEAPAPDTKAGDSSAEAAANSLMAEIQGGSLDSTIKKAQKEAAELKKEMNSPKAKRWVEGLMADLVAEKSRLHDIAKKLNLSIRQKEIEFRTRETSFQEELRRRDEMLKQKNNALTRAKEQVAQMTVSVERAKAASASAQDDAHFKQKYALSQKVLTSVKEENTQLAKKVDDLKTQLMSAQMASKSRGTPAPEVGALQAKYERAQRQVEEFKKQNQQLMEKLADSASGAKKDKASANGGVNIEEMKKRLEQAMKMASTHQKNAESVQLRVEELEREEERLKKELERAYAELKAFKSGTGTPPKAA